MTFKLVFSPELDIDPQSFANFWNSHAELQAQAVAQVQNVRGMATYNIPAWALAALFFVGGMATDIAKDVIIEHITEYLLKKGENTCHPEFEVIERKTETGETLLIVLPKKQE